MTPEHYAERRLQILEQVTRDLMMVVLQAHPMAGSYVNNIGQQWDQALDRMDSERAWANAAIAVQEADRAPAQGAGGPP